MIVHNQEVRFPLLDRQRISLCIKREDEIHPLISGNKFRKLKYNLKEAKSQHKTTLLTFGGAFSNHIAATACVGYEEDFQTVGIIRGEELTNTWKENPTLKLAATHGMQFHFVNRETYRKKPPGFLEVLKERHGDFYLLPEGGTNALAIQGCEEILTERDRTDFDIVVTSVGTGGTLAGLINASMSHQRVLGFSALKGGFLKEDIRKFANKSNWELITDYHFGGYAKVTLKLVEFINDFKKTTGILLDPVYTGKAVFGILDLIEKGRFRPNTKILVIHTGGLQGILGMNTVLKRKNLPLIDL